MPASRCSSACEAGRRRDGQPEAGDTPLWTAEDLAGKGAAQKGARWNHAGEHVTYAATSISLAAWETRAHFGKGAALPWNRYLVRVSVPDDVWAARLDPRSG